LRLGDRQITFYHDNDDDDDDDDHHHYKIEDKVKTTLAKVGDNEETEYVGLDMGPLERSRRSEVCTVECDLWRQGVRALAELNWCDHCVTVLVSALTLPSITLSSLTLSSLILSSTTLSSLTLSFITLSSLTLSSLTLSSLTLPSITLSSLTLSSITLPSLTLSSLSHYITTFGTPSIAIADALPLPLPLPFLASVQLTFLLRGKVMFRIKFTAKCCEQYSENERKFE
jgi:hypothetical protein